MMGVEEIKNEALRLSAEARAYLVRELLLSLEDGDGDIDELWLNEAISRDKELDGGFAKKIPVDDVLKRAYDKRKQEL
jgi:hypothetical protein